MSSLAAAASLLQMSANELESALERARVVAALDAWATGGRYWQCDGDAEVQLFTHCDSAPLCFCAEAPDAARAAAVKAIEAGKV